MPYTTVDQVRSYLVADHPVSEQVTDQPIQLTDTAWLKFYGGSIDADSLQVKSRRNYTLTRQQFTLTSSPTQLSTTPIVQGSIIVASDSSLGAVFCENQDYTINYANRTLAIMTGGQLSAGQTVTIWFETYYLYQSGADYQLNSERGEVRRLSGGDIPSGETVFLDYVPTYKSFTDDILLAAVNEANGLVEHEVDPNTQFDAEPTLVAAATCRALEIICRSAATRELSSFRGDDKIALAWLKLADNYATRSDLLLQTFRPPVIGPNKPALS